MPWTARDAYRHNRRANTPSLQSQWATVANNVLEQTGDEGRAIREASAAIEKRNPSKSGRPSQQPPDPGMAPPQSPPGGD